MNPLWYFTGYREYSMPLADSIHFLNLCMQNGYVYSRFSSDGETIHFCCSDQTGRLFDKKGITAYLNLTCRRKCGLPQFLYKQRQRAGILAGILMAMMIGFFLTRMVWCVQVTGNTTVSTAEVLEQLKSAGLYVGASRSSLDPDDVELNLLMSSDNLSWVSVNMSGTVAKVQVREKTLTEPGEISCKPANIIAGVSGEIIYTEILRGNALVMAGDRVNAGDLLISGVFDSTSVGFRWTRASGHVYAETVKEFQVEVPLHYKKITMTETGKKEIWLSFFGKEIKVFKNTGNTEGNCDTIDTVKDFGFREGKSLPFFLRSVRYIAYSETDETRAVKEAENLAYYQLSGQIAEWLGDKGSLLRKNITVIVTEDSYIIHCTAVGITDIAVISEFDLDLS